MSRFISFLTLVFIGLAPLHAADDKAVAARAATLDLAGAFTANDGYKLRDGYFTTSLKTGESKIFAVNLYFGNSYWFCMATVPAAKKISVTVFDETGKPVAIQPFNDGARAAAGFSAGASGLYFIKMSVVEGNDAEASTACLLYAYK